MSIKGLCGSTALTQELFVSERAIRDIVCKLLGRAGKYMYAFKEGTFADRPANSRCMQMEILFALGFTDLHFKLPTSCGVAWSVYLLGQYDT